MIRRMRRAGWSGGGVLALLAVLALVLSNTILPPMARAAASADPLAALLDICTAHGPDATGGTDPSADLPTPSHDHRGCAGCIVAAGAAIGPASPALPLPRLRAMRADAGPPPFPVRPSRRRLRPPTTAPPSRT